LKRDADARAVDEEASIPPAYEALKHLDSELPALDRMSIPPAYEALKRPLSHAALHPYRVDPARLRGVETPRQQPSRIRPIQSIPPAYEALKPVRVRAFRPRTTSIPPAYEALKRRDETRRLFRRVSIPPAYEALKHGPVLHLNPT